MPLNRSGSLGRQRALAPDMEKLVFIQLNHGWNGEPNAPDPRVQVDGRWVELRFYLNPWAYEAQEEEVGFLTFHDVYAWRLGPANDEGWYNGQCRYSLTAPTWREFCEIRRDDPAACRPEDWRRKPPFGIGDRHFLFYFRD